MSTTRAKANTRDLAFYQRRLAELMAARNGALGGLASFTAAAGHVVTISRNGTVVAVYPLDDIAWTELLRRAFVATSAQLRNDRPGGRWNFATTGSVSPLAGEQIKKLGWENRTAQAAALNCRRKAVRSLTPGRNLS